MERATRALRIRPDGCASRRDPRVSSRSIPPVVVFDMDGTLTRAEIDFVSMRSRTSILKGDLFSTMESWSCDETIRRAMDVILEMEASARQKTEVQPHLEELLEFLDESDVRLALVTRNTKEGTEAFFRLLHPRWKERFEVVLTREFRFVKPDARLLHHVARRLGVRESEMLMVGDSREDVECGKAAGTMTCLLEGGGNEVRIGKDTKDRLEIDIQEEACASFGFCDEDLESYEAVLEEEAEAIPTIRAKDLAHLKELLENGALEGIECHPPESIAFASHLRTSGHIRAAASSYPRIARAAGGFCGDGGDFADRVMHLGCSQGALTMALSCQGMRTLGLDTRLEAVEATRARGLQALHVPHWHEGNTFQEAAALLGGGASIVIAHGIAAASIPWGEKSVLLNLHRAMLPGGKICAHLNTDMDVATIRDALRSANFMLAVWSIDPTNQVLEFVAKKA